LIKSDPGAAETHIQEAERLTKDLRQELTNLIQQLRPVALEGKGLAAALGEYAEDWSRQNGIIAEVHVQYQRALPLEIEQTVFRIVQEALANVARHSNSSSVDINLIYTKDIVSCSIHDDGEGFDPDKDRKGVGLRSMSERADAVGGRLTIESNQSEGTSISITIPINGSMDSDMEEIHE
jgi:NarL family two-component system sensor histidine kinase LiaS